MYCDEGIYIYSAMDIARYIINFCIDIGSPIENVKLQKILYYVQVAFLLEEHSPCFNEEITKWRHRPVVIDVYKSYRGFIDLPIIKQEHYKQLELNDELEVKLITKTFDANIIKSEHQKLINKVVLGLASVDTWDLVSKTQEEEPFICTKKDDVMSLLSIYTYFSKSISNEMRIYGKYYD